MKKSISLLFIIVLCMALIEIGITYMSRDSNVPELMVNDIASLGSIKENYKIITLYEQSYIKNSGISWSYNKYLKKYMFITLNTVITVNNIEKLDSGYLNPSVYCNQTLRKDLKFDEIENEIFTQRTKVYEERLRDPNAVLEENSTLIQEYNTILRLMNECLYQKSSKAISSNVFRKSITESIFFPEYFQLSEFFFTNNNANQNINGIDTATIGWIILVDKIGSLGIQLFEEEPIIFKNSNGKEIIISQKERKDKAISVFKDLMQISSAYDKIEYGSENENIFYLSYYPYYNKILLIVKAKNDTALKDAYVSIGNKEYMTEINYPFIIVNNVELPEGNYTVRLKTASKTHTIPMKVQYPPFIGGSQISTIDKFTFELTSTSQNRISIEKISITNNKLKVNCQYNKKTEMTYMNMTTIELDCPSLQNLEKDVPYVYDLSIDYSDEMNNKMTTKGSMKVYLNNFE